MLNTSESVVIYVEPPFLSIHRVSNVNTFSKQLELMPLAMELDKLKDEIEDEEVLDSNKGELDEDLER